MLFGLGVGSVAPYYPARDAPDNRGREPIRTRLGSRAGAPAIRYYCGEEIAATGPSDRNTTLETR